MHKKAILIGVIVLIVGAGSTWYLSKEPALGNAPDLEEIATNTTKAKLVSPQEFAQLAKEENAFILDVHTPEQTHIPGTDAFIPFDQIAENKDKLPVDKNIPILLYCRSGGMSAQASKELINMGYTNVYDLEGGTDAYKESNNGVFLAPDTKEFGTVMYGDVVTTTYTLTNYTPLPVKITRITTSCGCTKAEIEKKEIEPYEAAVVNVSFDPAVHKDDSDLGDLTRVIYIETDNPNFKELESSFTATVIKNN